MSEQKDVQEFVLKARLAHAQMFIDSGKPEEAERIYKLALEQAEAAEGKDSPLAGLVLLELFDLYRKQGRDEEGKPLWNRMRKILMRHVQEHLYAEAGSTGEKQGDRRRFKPRFCKQRGG